MNLAQRIRLAWRALRSPDVGAVGLFAPAWEEGRSAGLPDDPAEQVTHHRHWVYVAVRAIRDRVAAARLRLLARRNGAWTAIDEHPFLDLLQAVNPVDTRWRLLASTAEHLELTGNAYWYVARNGLGAPAEIWPLPPQRVHVVPDRQRVVRGYRYLPPSATTAVEFDRSEVVHFRYPNPRNLFYGWSPLQAAAEAVDAHEEMLRAQVKAFQQGVRPPKIFFSTPNVITDEAQLERLKENLARRYASVDKAEAILVAHGGLRPERLTLTPEEMDFLNSRRVTRDEILAVFGVPAAIAGISEDVNRASADALERIFSRNTIAPKLALIAQQIEQDLLPMYPADLRCEFDAAGPEDREQTRRDATAAFDRGALSVDELRQMLTGRPPLKRP